jgi:nitric oxide reductase
MEALRADAGLVPSAVREICRYHTASAYALRRVALEDVQARRAGYCLLCASWERARLPTAHPADPPACTLIIAPRPAQTAVAPVQAPQVGGQVVRAGEGIIALNQSANRDEDAFPDPDTFNIRREPNPQVPRGGRAVRVKPTGRGGCWQCLR